jgi:hypothetical protein
MKFITIGSDPEFFVLDPKGKPYPATLFAVGTKDKPVPIESLGKGFYEQRDNLSFEGNVPPAPNKDDFILNIKALRQYFERKVSRVGYSLSTNGVEYFEKRYLSTSEAMEFGCSSVIDSWSSSIRNKIIARPTPNLTGYKFRVSGFHIHIGYDTPLSNIGKGMTDVLIGRLFDIFLTTPSHKIKSEPERLKTYGKWGMIRSKEYGVECRTLSSFFTQEEHLSWVWDQIMKMEDFINKMNVPDIERFISYGYGFGNYVSNSYFQLCVRDMFREFKNVELINKFDETREIYEYKTDYEKTHPDGDPASMYRSAVSRS